MRRPVLAALVSILVIPGTSAADEVAEADSGVADPAETVEPPAPEASETRVAHAGPPGTAEVELPPPAPPPPVAPGALESARDADAAAGRAYLTPTAITGRKGSVRLDTWFPGVPVAGHATLSYAVTNRVEIGAGMFWIAEESEDRAVSLRVKWAPLRTARGGIAVELQHLAIPDEDDSLTFGSVVGSYCLDAACRTVGSLSLTGIPERDAYDPQTDSYGTALHTIAGGSLVTGGKVKLVLDLISIEDGDDHVFAGYAGARIARAGWALDAGLVAGGEDGDAELLPLPLVGATARW